MPRPCCGSATSSAPGVDIVAEDDRWSLVGDGKYWPPSRTNTYSTILAPVTLVSSVPYVDKALSSLAPSTTRAPRPPVALGVNVMLSVQLASGKHRRAIICGSEVLPLTWCAIHSAANRLWCAAGVGHGDGLGALVVLTICLPNSTEVGFTEKDSPE